MPPKYYHYASLPLFLASHAALLDDPVVDIVICNSFFSPPGITDKLIPQIAGRSKKTPQANSGVHQLWSFYRQNLKTFL